MINELLNHWNITYEFVVTLIWKVLKFNEFQDENEENTANKTNMHIRKVTRTVIFKEICFYVSLK